MSQPQDIQATIAELLSAMREKLGVRAETMHDGRTKAKRLLPHRVFKSYDVLQKAEPFLAHPKLRLTLDDVALTAATKDVRTYLDDINLAERRKSWWLNLAAGVAFNLLAFAVLLIVVLVWRGIL